MILADENIDHSIIDALRVAGYSVTSVYELPRGMSDESIIQFSHNPPRIILTEDKGFGANGLLHMAFATSVSFSCDIISGYCGAVGYVAGIASYSSAQFDWGLHHRGRTKDSDSSTLILFRRNPKSPISQCRAAYSSSSRPSSSLPSRP